MNESGPSPVRCAAGSPHTSSRPARSASARSWPRVATGLAAAILIFVAGPARVPAASDANTPAVISPKERAIVERARSQWAFQPLRRPGVPATSEANVHPVDAFVAAGLKSKGLLPNPPAEPRDLIRRVYFDLIGLPPTPEEVAAFEASTAPDRYERVVEDLLARPQYGERWARHWLDLARYSESTGFEYDRLRDHAWHYRDYVIRSFNQDKPYDLFMREQIAGDVLEPITHDGILATSLLVCGAYDQAGNAQANATQRAITREEELEDLIGTVGQAFLGLTLNCARCHDHKFDPIPQTEYYRIKSVFDGVMHGERPVETPAEVRAREERLAAAQQELDAATAAVARLHQAGWRLARERHPGPSSEPGLVPWMQWVFDATSTPEPAGTFAGGAIRSDGRLQLPGAGARFQSSPISRDLREKTLEAWVCLATLEQRGGAVISVESADGSKFDSILFGRQPRQWAAGSDGSARTRDLEGPEETTALGGWIHVAAVYRSDNSIALFRNGVPYGKPYLPGSPLQTFKAGEAHVVLGLRQKGAGGPWLNGSIQKAALHDRALSDAEIAASFRAGGFTNLDAEVVSALSREQQAGLAASLAAAAKAREDIALLGRPAPVAYAGKRVQPSPTQRLKRGDVKSPDGVVSAAALAAVAEIPAEFGLAPDAPEAQRRLKFADWLADPRNPLPARVMANRVWQHHFGQGLVTTPSDFGAGGSQPSHPELLDWLAAQLIDSGWRVKSLHRLIVLSDTYRRSSRFNPDSARVDADNQFLWRYQPRRLEAELLRDAMLSVSGRINLHVGGPSFRPFTTTDFNATFYHPFDKDEPEFNRRTVYRMNVNSGKDPLLDAFDCPDPSVKAPRRGVTTTPLQALGLMNGSFVQRQARLLAERAQSRAPGDLSRAVNAAYLLALGRPAAPDELQRAAAAARDRGLSSVCWALLNSTEFAYVR